jgi:transcriptional regulator with GAF, ATPase, and Fis domain
MKPIEEIPPIKSPIKLDEVVGNFERRLIVEALKECNGVQTRAAELLGTTRRILRYRMDKLDIRVQRNQLKSSSCQTTVEQ